MKNFLVGYFFSSGKETPLYTLHLFQFFQRIREGTSNLLEQETKHMSGTQNQDRAWNDLELPS